jgi:hypothetical protein
MKKILAVLWLAFSYAPQIKITRLSGELYKLSQESTKLISEHIPPDMQLKPGTFLPPELSQMLHGHGLRGTFIIDHSANESLELQQILVPLNIEQDQRGQNLFDVSHPDIKNAEQFGLRFKPHNYYFPGLKDDEVDKLGAHEFLKLRRPYGFNLSYDARSPIRSERPIKFYWASDTQTAEEYWSPGMVKDNLDELFRSKSLDTLPLIIEIPYQYWIGKFPGPITIKSNLQTEPDHFGNFVDTIDAVTSELKKIAEKLEDPSFVSPNPDEILKQLSHALENVPHGDLHIHINSRSEY